MALNLLILSLISLSSAKIPICKNLTPIMKYLTDRYCATVSEISLLSHTEIVMSSIFSLKAIPKNVFTIVSPAIEADNY